MKLYVWNGGIWTHIWSADAANMQYWRDYYRKSRVVPLCTCVVKR